MTGLIVAVLIIAVMVGGIILGIHLESKRQLRTYIEIQKAIGNYRFYKEE